MHRAPGAGDHLEEWEDLLLRTEARVFAQRRRLRWSDADDLCQEAALTWLRQREAWDPGRASAATYLKKVARHAMADVARAEGAKSREGSRTAALLSAPSSETDEPTLEDRVGSTDSIVAADLALAVARVLARLTSRQRQLLRGRAAGYQVHELAARLGVHRDTLHQEKLRIREVFHDEGLISGTDPT